MAAPYLVLTIFAYTFPTPFPGSPSSPSQEQQVQSYGQKASVHCIFREASPNECLPPAGGAQRSNPTASSRSHPRNMIWERMSGRICLPLRVQEHTISTENTFVKGMDAPPSPGGCTALSAAVEGSRRAGLPARLPTLTA